MIPQPSEDLDLEDRDAPVADSQDQVGSVGSVDRDLALNANVVRRHSKAEDAKCRGGIGGYQDGEHVGPPVLRVQRQSEADIR